MNKQEFEAWKEHTASSAGRWTVDPVHNGQGRDLLIHKGGVDGDYVLVLPDGTLSIGAYAGAVPHIGEALFTPRGAKKFADFDTALARAIEAGGLAFLRDLI